MRYILAALGFLILSGVAFAHSWYDADCCSDRDCHPVACDEINDEPDGYHWNGFVFKKEKARPSKDKDCHVCIMDRTRWGGTGQMPMCIYIQQNS